MIGIVVQPEPHNFDTAVRTPGKKILQKRQVNPAKKFKNYWKEVSSDLHTAYKGICAYSCMYILAPGSVDHFLPKDQYPNLAYEWSNYRLASPKVNQHKDNSIDVIDPFTVQPGWFVLDFPSCLVLSGDGLSDTLKTQIETTIKILKLNDDDGLVQERCDIMLSFVEGEIQLSFLSKRYPFLALEIERQNIQDIVGDIFKKHR